MIFFEGVDPNMCKTYPGLSMSGYFIPSQQLFASSSNSKEWEEFPEMFHSVDSFGINLDIICLKICNSAGIHLESESSWAVEFEQSDC